MKTYEQTVEEIQENIRRKKEEGLPLSLSERIMEKSMHLEDIAEGRVPTYGEEEETNESGEEKSVATTPTDRGKAKGTAKKKKREPFIQVFFNGCLLAALSMCAIVIFGLFCLIPIINLLAFPLVVIAIFVLVFVSPALLILNTIQWSCGESLTDIKSYKKHLREKVVQERKNKIKAEEAKRKQDEQIDRVAREQLKEEEEKKAQREKQDAIKNMKVDMGDGKKVKFDDLPKHLQEQLLEEYRKEQNREQS